MHVTDDMAEGTKHLASAWGAGSVPGDDPENCMFNSAGTLVSLVVASVT
jgi:hypothetical protein